MQSSAPIRKAAQVLKRLTAVLIAVASPTAGANGLAQEDVQRIIEAVVGVEARVPADARSVESLGQRRTGTGMVIDGNGLVLTVGYLILEAAEVSVYGLDGKALPAAVVGYDHETGFGLVRTALPIDVKPLALGRSSDVAVGDTVLAIARIGPSPLMPQMVVDRRDFAGNWEYLLENALFTSPPVSGFGGAALIGVDGTLLGVGSLFVQDAMAGHAPLPGNMFIPIDLLKPILADLLTDGRRSGPAQPWLGLYTGEAAGRVVVARVVAGGPAEAAGMKPGDIIMGVGGKSVRDMVDFMRKVRTYGKAGDDIPIDVMSSDTPDMTIGRRIIHSRDRHDWLRLKRGL
ncbi:MAG: S1C family serine protease [Rhodospirillales bacterium]|jgi:S1-C subfamily serine protease|nr:S1C family serine protease [Rhodospirillales bacterium]